MPWMREGMQQGLDCRTYGCFDPAGVVAGFIVPEETTLWLRKDVFDAYTRDEAGNRLPDGENGEVVVCRPRIPSWSCRWNTWAVSDIIPVKTAP